MHKRISGIKLKMHKAILWDSVADPANVYKFIKKLN